MIDPLGEIDMFPSQNNRPPKPAMEEIVERLQLPGQYWTSRGGTARTPFFADVAQALGVKMPPVVRLVDKKGARGVPSYGVNKQDIAKWAWRAVNDGKPPSKGWSSGSKVTNALVDGILQGMKDLDIDYRLSPPSLTPDTDFGGDDPSLLELVDSRKRTVREAFVREGQPAFRRAVMGAYKDTCCITGTDVPQALEAAHITEYKGKQSNRVTNGLALRGDIHTMFDRGQISIHEASMEVLLKPEIAETHIYGHLAGRLITLPDDPANHPDPVLLRANRVGAGFRDRTDTDV